MFKAHYLRFIMRYETLNQATIVIFQCGWKFCVEHSSVNDIHPLECKKKNKTVIHVRVYLPRKLAAQGLDLHIFSWPCEWTGNIEWLFSAFLKCMDNLSGKYCHQVPLCHHPFKPLLTILKNLICYKLNYVKRKFIEKD